MAKLEGLIKLKDHVLDEKRQELAKVNARLEALENEKKAFLERVEKEKKSSREKSALRRRRWAFY